MARKGFTLIEVLVVIVIIGILATVGIPTYQNFIEDSKSRVCQNNLLTLKAALDIYVVENGVVPADLTKIPAATIKKVFAQKLREGGVPLQVAYAVVELDHRGLAFADIISDIAGGGPQFLRCPKAKPGQKTSYGLFKPLVPPKDGENTAWLTPAAFSEVVKNSDVPFIADCSEPTFDSAGQIATDRHSQIKAFNKTETFANVIYQDEAIVAVATGHRILKATLKGFTYSGGDILPDIKLSPESKEDIKRAFSRSLSTNISVITSHLEREGSAGTQEQAGYSPTN